MSDSRTPLGVFLLAYGTPEKLDDVEEYYTNVRKGRKPEPEKVEELRERYAMVGGRTPLLEISQSTAQGLQNRLEQAYPGQYKVYLGMKYWHPYIADVLQEMAQDGITDAIGLVLAPHYSKMSVGGYRDYVEKGQERLDTPINIQVIESWQENAAFRRMIAERITTTMEQFPAEARSQVTVLFSAHSLPERIKTWGDPYEEQLLESAAGVAELLGLQDWRFCFQSAGATGEPWLGPDICDYMDELAQEGKRYILSVPFGFVSEHLEIFYDIDYEAQQKAEEHGMMLHRIRMPNADPEFVEVLASVVISAKGQSVATNS